MQMNKPMSSPYDHHHPDFDDFGDQYAPDISFQFSERLQLDDKENSDSRQELPANEDLGRFQGFEDEEEEEEDDEEDENDDDFTFMYIGDNDSPISPGKVFEDGQIRPVFPLFDQNLLLGDNYDIEGGSQLPMRPPVDRIFIESPHGPTSSSTSEPEEIDMVAAGPYCAWSKKPDDSTPELSKKSNSTGFSKLWRFRDKVGRSNSDGRDAFVFLNNSNRSTTATTSSAVNSSSSTKREDNPKPAAGDGSSVTVNVAGGEKPKAVKRVVRQKKAAAISAHEVYLKNKLGQTEERRRSYLPYKPELMGFFTNVHGGLSRNVHPF